jgi:hypothetical protein
LYPRMQLLFFRCSLMEIPLIYLHLSLYNYKVKDYISLIEFTPLLGWSNAGQIIVIHLEMRWRNDPSGYGKGI